MRLRPSPRAVCHARRGTRAAQACVMLQRMRSAAAVPVPSRYSADQVDQLDRLQLERLQLERVGSAALAASWVAQSAQLQLERAKSAERPPDALLQLDRLQLDRVESTSPVIASTASLGTTPWFAE